MKQPRIDVDEATYNLFEEYVEDWKLFYNEKLSEIYGGQEFESLPDDKKRLVAVYSARINCLTLLVGNMESFSISFTE